MNIYINIYIYIYINTNTYKFPFASDSSGENHSFFQKVSFSEMTGMRNLSCSTFRLLLLLQPWDLSHRVQRQKLMVNSLEEMSVRIWKGGFVANLLLDSKFRPNVLFEIW